MKKAKIKHISLIIVFSLILGSCFFINATAEDNDNFGSFFDLVDIDHELLELKDERVYTMDSKFLKGIDPETDCATVASMFKNTSIAIFDKDGVMLSADDTVCTSCSVKLLDAKGHVADSRIIAVKGDTNCDGEATSTDVTLILRYDSGMIDLSDEALIAADVSGDGESDSVDAGIILKYDCGILSDL